MSKTLNQIFFSSTKIRIFFQQHWESEYFFRKKTWRELKKQISNFVEFRDKYEQITCTNIFQDYINKT